MRGLFRLSLVLVLLLTGITLGAARGQARIAGVIVLCAGGAITTQMVDRDGKPVRVMLICPDMALSLMAAPEVPPVALPLPQATARALATTPTAPLPHGHAPVTPRARGPPPLA